MWVCLLYRQAFYNGGTKVGDNTFTRLIKDENLRVVNFYEDLSFQQFSYNML